jgi:hypothetical protein
MGPVGDPLAGANELVTVVDEELEVGAGAVVHRVAQALAAQRGSGDGARIGGIRLAL